MSTAFEFETLDLGMVYGLDALMTGTPRGGFRDFPRFIETWAAGTMGSGSH